MSNKTLLCYYMASVIILLWATVAGTIYDVDICRDDQNFRCDTGKLISLLDTSCGSGRPQCTASVNQALRSLCHGRQACSTLALRGMFSAYCSEGAVFKRSVRVRFQCSSGNSSSCQANICADNSEGLRCPNGSLIHIQQLACSTVTGTCPSSSYTGLYLCEGVQRCGASGLKDLLPQHCRHPNVNMRNLFVNYVCVPENKINAACPKKNYRAVTDSFGLLTPPYSNDNEEGRQICKWGIHPQADQRIKLSLSLVNVRPSSPSCSPGVLNIHYTDCETQGRATKSVCEDSVELISCGTVFITTMEMPTTEVDKIIISYQRIKSNDIDSSPEELQMCVAPDVTGRKPPTPQVLPHTPSSRPASISHNFGPAEGMFDYRDSSYQKDGSSGNEDDSSTLSKQLKLMILYIFFGVVILVLLVALIAVLVSYRKISKVKGSQSDSSEKTALWQHHEDTPLDTFHSSTRIDGLHTPSSETTYAFKSGHDVNQVIATVHHDAISENDDFDPRISSGSGISTFLAGRGETDFKDLINSFQTDSFALYSSIDDGRNRDTHQQRNADGGYFEIPESGHYSMPGIGEINNIYEVIDRDHRRSGGDFGNHNHSANVSCNRPNPQDEIHVGFNHDQQPLVAQEHSPSDDLHYRVNNDEYAVVRKSRKLANPYM